MCSSDLMKETLAQRTEKNVGNRCAPGALPGKCNSIAVTSKVADVLLNPLQRSDRVVKAGIARNLVGIQTEETLTKEKSRNERC